MFACDVFPLFIKKKRGDPSPPPPPCLVTRQCRSLLTLTFIPVNHVLLFPIFDMLPRRKSGAPPSAPLKILPKLRHCNSPKWLPGVQSFPTLSHNAVSPLCMCSLCHDSSRMSAPTVMIHTVKKCNQRNLTPLVKCL